MKVPRYLDEIDPKTLTDEQREKLRHIYETDPYTFYNMWRDPAQAQIWAEGENFGTEPANDYFAKIGALRLARAPEAVVDFWKDVLEHKARDESDDLLQPAKKPVVEKLQQIEDLCEYLDGLLNWVEDNTEPDTPEDDFPENIPFSGKWTRLMQRATGNMIAEHHDGTVQHFRSTDVVQANMGVEVVEVELESESEMILDLEDWDKNYIKPEACSISRNGTRTRIRLEFYHCYE